MELTLEAHPYRLLFLADTQRIHDKKMNLDAEYKAKNESRRQDKEGGAECFYARPSTQSQRTCLCGARVVSVRAGQVTTDTALRVILTFHEQKVL